MAENWQEFWKSPKMWINIFSHAKTIIRQKIDSIKCFQKKKGEPVRFWHFIFLVPTGRKKIVAEKTAEIIRLSGFMFFFLTFFCCRFIPKNLALFLRPVVSLTALSDEGRKKIGEPHWLIYGPVNIGASIRQRVANIPLFFLQWNERLKRRIFFLKF